jgi:hypothetical protein
LHRQWRGVNDAILPLLAMLAIASYPRLARRHCRRVVVVALLQASSAFAQAADDRATLGQELFDQGRALMEEKDYPRACKKFEESARLDRAVGTVLNLALCYELQGKTATAWAQFREALSLARREGRLDRRQFAEEHIQALAQRMSRVRISVPPESRVPGLVVHRNGIALTESAWDEALGVDPGPLEVKAWAPGRKPYETTIEMGSERDLKTVVIPLLTPDTPPPRPAAVPSPRAFAPPRNEGTTQRWVAYGVGALGLAAIGAGSFFGIRAINRQNEAQDLCPSSERCDPRGFPLSERAEADGQLATYFIAGGAVLVGAAGVLLITAPSGRRGQTAVLTLTGGF